jgi:pimeloyl-ACP methyl ester carboxylesterase
MLPALVLVHGGQHTGQCWSPTIAELPVGTAVLAVDLPGRGSTPGDLASVTIADNVASVVAQVERAGLDEVVLVGHSMAGITLPGVASALGDRVRRLVFVSCCVPRQGERVIDTLDGPLRWFAERATRGSGVAKPLPRPAARAFFCNGMTAAQRAVTYAAMCHEAVGPTAERVDRSTMPDVPRTWVLLARDRSLPPRKQRQFVANLGGVDEVIALDTCHDAMISEPHALAQVLAAQLRR